MHSCATTWQAVGLTHKQAAIAASKLTRVLGVNIVARDFYKHTTMRSLTDHIMAIMATDHIMAMKSSTTPLTVVGVVSTLMQTLGELLKHD
tara:strand:+ start:1090 stop:1362 length:273 start_codon:yes stop_codon:yes gene_type:complete